jgi:hypothetical protein
MKDVLHDDMRVEIIARLKSATADLARLYPDVAHEVLWAQVIALDPEFDLAAHGLIDAADADLHSIRLQYLIRSQAIKLAQIDRVACAGVLDAVLEELCSAGFTSFDEAGRWFAGTQVNGLSTPERIKLFDALLEAVPGDLSHINKIKKHLLSIWRFLPVPARKAFLERLDDKNGFDFGLTAPVAKAGQTPLEEILIRWREVLPFTADDERTFALDIEKRRRWKNWNPTPKQEKWIRQIFDDVQRQLKSGEGLASADDPITEDD